MDVMMIRNLGVLYRDMVRILDILRPNLYAELTAPHMIDMASKRPILGIAAVHICLISNDLYTKNMMSATRSIYAQLDYTDAAIVLNLEQQNEWLAGYQNGIQPKSPT